MEPVSPRRCASTRAIFVAAMLLLLVSAGVLVVAQLTSKLELTLASHAMLQEKLSATTQQLKEAETKLDALQQTKRDSESSKASLASTWAQRARQEAKLSHGLRYGQELVSARASGSSADQSNSSTHPQNSLLKSSQCLLNTYRNRFNHSHSINGEEFTLILTLVRAAGALAGGVPGTFVELGAFDGETHSNSAILERCFHWNGLLIEANPANAAKLKKSTRKATKVHSAICPTRGMVNFTVRGGPVAGQLNQLSERHQRDWSTLNKPEMFAPVSCQPLAAIMATADLPEATFLSLDVEGAEATVMETIRPSAFKVIMVETDGDDKDKEQRVDRRIKAHGLRLVPGVLHGMSQSSLYVRGDVETHSIPKWWHKANRFENRRAPARNLTAEIMASTLADFLAA